MLTGGGMAALIGLIVPLVVAIVASTKTTGAIKGAIAAVVSIIVGAAVVFGTGNPTVEAYAVGIVTVVAAAQASYGMFWKPMGITSWILEHLGNVATTLRE